VLEYDPVSAYNMITLNVEEWTKLNEEIQTNPTMKTLYNLYVTVSTNDTAPWDLEQKHNKGLIF
jgi:hypothetical protein